MVAEQVVFWCFVLFCAGPTRSKKENAAAEKGYKPGVRGVNLVQSSRVNLKTEAQAQSLSPAASTPCQAP